MKLKRSSTMASFYITYSELNFGKSCRLSISIDETRNQIPHYTDVVKNHQEKALESTGKWLKIMYVLKYSKIRNANPYYENASFIIQKF